jgi:hypothetical protein
MGYEAERHWNRFGPRSLASNARGSMLTQTNLQQFRTEGWTRIRSAAPRALYARLVDVLIDDVGVPVNDPMRWDVYGGDMQDLLPIWGHQVQWDIRQHPAMHEIWSRL